MTIPVIHPLALASVAVLGLLLFGLGLCVSLVRGKAHVLIGTPPDPDSALGRIVRAHGNTAEYAPMLALLFLYHGARSPSALVLTLIVAGALARILFVAGLLTAPTLTRPSPLRFIGAASTYVIGAWLSVLLFWA